MYFMWFWFKTTWNTSKCNNSTSRKKSPKLSDPNPCGEGDTLSPHSTPSTPSASRPIDAFGMPWERVPYLSALEVCLRQGAIQIHVYLTFYLTFGISSCLPSLYDIQDRAYAPDANSRFRLWIWTRSWLATNHLSARGLCSQSRSCRLRQGCVPEGAVH